MPLSNYFQSFIHSLYFISSMPLLYIILFNFHAKPIVQVWLVHFTDKKWANRDNISCPRLLFTGQQQNQVSNPNLFWPKAYVLNPITR